MPVSKLNLSILPSDAGVYLMKDKQGAVLYIGKAINIKKRVAQYFSGHEEQTRGWKISALMPLISQIDFVVCASERDALLLENKLIKQYQPFFNSMLKDDKSYSYLKLTVGEDYPRLLLTRKKIKDKSLYFGPYPKAYNIKQLLHFLRRSGFAPLRQCNYSFSRQKPLAENKIQGCIYYHTGQCCAPCAKISYEDYQKIVKRVALFLDGNFKQAKAELFAAMKAASKNLNYEEAAACRDLISALEQMGERIKVSKYDEEKLEHKLAVSAKLKELTRVLKSPVLINHIEAFDNSHLFGKEAVGAMVCFIDGEKYKAHYRRFKIKAQMKATGADDFLMMKECVLRRLNQLKNLAPEKRPQLFLIDGGKGQLNFAAQAIKEAGLDIQIISLAKKEEEIFLPNRSNSLRLPKNSPALRLLQEIRDEVHRFVITYHRLLRNKALYK